jgi:hypothetical protein
MSTARPSIAIRTSLVELVATNTVSSLICPPPTIVNSSPNRPAISSPSGAGNVGPMENEVVNENLCKLTAGSIKREGRREAVQFISRTVAAGPNLRFPSRSESPYTFHLSGTSPCQGQVSATQPGMCSGYRRSPFTGSRGQRLSPGVATPGRGPCAGAKHRALPGTDYERTDGETGSLTSKPLGAWRWTCPRSWFTRRPPRVAALRYARRSGPIRPGPGPYAARGSRGPPESRSSSC